MKNQGFSHSKYLPAAQSMQVLKKGKVIVMDVVNSVAGSVMNLFKDNPNKLVKNNHFWVFIGVLKISFTKVSGFEQDVDTEYIVEGGVNDAGVQLIVPKKERHILRCERGLQTWSPVLTRMKPGVEIPLGITVIMMNDKNIPVHVYHAFDCVVTKWEVGEFDANTGEIVIETFEVSYTSCDRTNLQLF